MGKKTMATNLPNVGEVDDQRDGVKAVPSVPSVPPPRRHHFFGLALALVEGLLLCVLWVS